MPGVDYRAVRAAVTMQDVLTLLGWKPRSVAGPLVRGGCPVHTSTHRTSLAFSAQLRRGVWFCHSCKAGGNVIDLYAAVKLLPTFLAAVELCDRLARPVPWIDREGRPVVVHPEAPRGEQEEAPVHLPPRFYGPRGRRCAPQGPSQGQGE